MRSHKLEGNVKSNYDYYGVVGLYMILFYFSICFYNEDKKRFKIA